jgi:hypothetical protein
VSNPPQAFNAEFLPTGKARMISGRRLLTGDFELFALAESIKAKYKATLINRESVKPSAGADTKVFAALSDGGSTQLECCVLAHEGNRTRRREVCGQSTEYLQDSFRLGTT